MNFKAIPWLGAVALMFSVLPGVWVFVGFSTEERAPAPSRSVSLQVPSVHSIQLSLAAPSPLLSLETAREQISFSIDPVRPDAPKSDPERRADSRFLVRLGSSRQTRQIAPQQGLVRLYLAFDSAGVLQFTETPSCFWIDCGLSPDGELMASLLVQDPAGDMCQAIHWTPPLQEPPVQSFHDFEAGHPFCELAAARWWGQDLLMERARPGSSCHRLEIGPPANAALVDCSLGDWLVWKDNRWQKVQTPSRLLARIKSVSPQSLEIEAWDEVSYTRIKIPLMILPPVKIKGEELFSQLRVRSEKQVSCMLDKQCLVLRPGDWVLKSDARWKILKKKEEKEAVLEGTLIGDLFILDRVDAKSPVKSIVGFYFPPGRTQSVLIEHAQKMHKGQKRAR